MRSWKYFNKEEATKFAKGNLALQNIPLTEENVKSELEDVYANWLALKLNDIIHASDGWSSGVEVCAFYRTLKEIPTKYYPIILQWLYDEPIHYEGKYFNFEEIYNNVKIVIEEKLLYGIYGFDAIVNCIDYFELYEKDMERYTTLTKKEKENFKQALKSSMYSAFFE